MATQTPFDPLWNFLFDEDDDSDSSSYEERSEFTHDDKSEAESREDSGKKQVQRGRKWGFSRKSVKLSDCEENASGSLKKDDEEISTLPSTACAKIEKRHSTRLGLRKVIIRPFHSFKPQATIFPPEIIEIAESSESVKKEIESDNPSDKKKSTVNHKESQSDNILFFLPKKKLKSKTVDDSQPDGEEITKDVPRSSKVAILGKNGRNKTNCQRVETSCSERTADVTTDTQEVSVDERNDTPDKRAESATTNGNYQGELQEDYVNVGDRFRRISILPSRDCDATEVDANGDNFSAADEGNSEPSARKGVGKLACWVNNKQQDTKDQKENCHSTDDDSRKCRLYHEGIKNEVESHSSFTYDYETQSTPLEVQYKFYGKWPAELLELHTSDLNSLDVKRGEAVLQIESSTISYTDCRVRKGELWTELKLPIVPGVDVVGRIHKIDQKSSLRSGFRIGDKVMSLVKTGGNARYIKLHVNQLVKVPEGVKSAQAVCLAESYLSGFQAVHCGQRVPERYKTNSLLGKSILILGAFTNVGRAALELADIAGATLMYAPCKQKQKHLIRAMGATPLGVDKSEWIHLLQKKIDVIVDATVDTGRDINDYFGVLNDDGDYILVGRTENDVAKIISNQTRQPGLVCSNLKSRMMNRIHSYCVFEKWEYCLESCKRDLSHLLRLLNEKQISPRVLDQIPLYKVARAQEILDEKRLKGYLVCEPFMKSKSRALYA